MLKGYVNNLDNNPDTNLDNHLVNEIDTDDTVDTVINNVDNFDMSTILSCINTLHTHTDHTLDLRDARLGYEVHEMQIYCKVTPAGPMLASSSTFSRRPLIVDSDHILQIKMISIIIALTFYFHQCHFSSTSSRKTAFTFFRSR